MSLSLLTELEPLKDTLPVVEMRHVTISFDGPPVLNDISFRVAPNETRICWGLQAWARACC